VFSRIREAIRIITYREPDSGPDAVIVDHKVATSSRAGRIISRGLEVLMVVYVLAYVSARISERLSKIIPSTHSVSVTTIAAAIGVLLMFLVHSIKDDIETKIRTRLNLAEALAPYFGHRLDYTIRVLKG
jgi:hypothetical protein